jgi:hypothetical protein
MLVFEIVTVVVCVVSAVIAAVSFVRGLKLYDKIGQLGTFAMTHDEEPSAATRELVREEVRQMLDALSQARKARGERSSAAELLDLLETSAAIRSTSRRGAAGNNPARSH